MEISESIDTEKDSIRAKLETTIERAEAVCHRLQERTTAAAKAADEAVRQHPWQAVGIAFGVGVLAGVVAMLNRRD